LNIFSPKLWENKFVFFYTHKYYSHLYCTYHIYIYTLVIIRQYTNFHNSCLPSFGFCTKLTIENDFVRSHLLER
jgi:hypothetical protein